MVELPRNSGPSAWRGALIGLAAVVVALVAAGAYFAYQETRVATPEVISVAPDGSALLLQVPGVADGSQLVWHGKVASVQQGRARLAVPEGALSIGPQTLNMQLLEPNTEPRPIEVPVHHEFQLVSSFDSLGQRPAEISATVLADPAAGIAVAGSQVEISAEGRGEVLLPVEPITDERSKVYRKRVSYEVARPDGSRRAGEVIFELPVASLQIDHPSRRLVTAAPEIEVAGVVHSAAQVYVDGERASVQAGSFRHLLELDGRGELHPPITVYVAGHAPRQARLDIERVRDIEAAAQRLAARARIGYAALRANPARHMGEPVALEGVLLDLAHKEGSHLQINAQPCGRRQRCPLWVEYPAPVDFELGTKLRVVGRFSGKQALRDASGEVVEVPKVQASYVLPSER